jgi:localization factor PodJL
MQPDLPWNIAGIPPEAREAARAAARRESLSVGEWLTRRILRSLAEGNSNVEGARDSWRHAELAGQTAAVQSAPDSTSRDSEDMLARVSRTEADSQDAYRRIEDQLRGVARRLDHSERSQSENNRAMSRAAAEINTATREQAQAFDRLGAHVVGLNDRLSRIERDAASDGVKDAVKALHQGLSRLADQMSQTAHQSASQTAALAGSIEQVAAKLIEARGDVDHVSAVLDDRIAVIDARVRNSERDAQIQASVAEKAMATVDAAQDARRSFDNELQRQSAGLSQLNETLDKLTARFDAGEAQYAGTMARLEESFSQLHAKGPDTNSENRLQNIEHALSDIVLRLEKAESNNLGAASTVEEGLRSLAARVDAVDRRQRDDVAELHATMKAAPPPAETRAPVSAPPPPPQQAPTSQFDLPPFLDSPEHEVQPPPPFANAPPMPAPPPAFGIDPAFAGHAFGADTFAANVANQAGTAGTESFLAAARRSARTAASGDAGQTGASFGFSWGSPGEAEPDPKNGIARYALMATLALLIVAAVAAGALLSRHLSAPATVAATSRYLPLPPPARIASALPAMPGQAVSTTPAATTAPANAPGSPAIAAQSSTQQPAQVQVDKLVPATVANPLAPKTLSSQQPPSTSSLDHLSALANTGNEKAELLLGLKLLDGDGVSVNEAEAAKWLERAGKQNDPIAAYRLGTLYERGHGVPADSSKAAHWYEIAARGGNRKAMHNLAVAYAGGSGVQKDLVVAAQWFTRAANLGLADSQFNLAVLYERGMGVQQSLIDAYKWYAIAAQQGDTESKARLDALNTQLSPEDKTAAEKAAQSFRPETTDRNANIPPDESMVLGG